MQLSPIISVYESDTSLLFPSFILVKGFHCWGQHCVEVRAEALAWVFGAHILGCDPEQVAWFLWDAVLYLQF